MGKLKIQFTSSFKRDVKRLDKKHISDYPLKVVMNLIIENTPESLGQLRRRHCMHTLKGSWAGSNECHVCNAGDWLLIWTTFNDIALMQRTGSHDELFRINSLN